MLDNVFTLDNAFVSMAVGLITAFMLFWAPGVGKLWARVEVKRLTLLGLFLGVPLVVTLVGCYVALPIKVVVVCSLSTDPNTALLANIWSALKLGFSGLAASQGGYLALLKWAPELMHPDQKITIPPALLDWLTGKQQSGPTVSSVWDPYPVKTEVTTEVGGTADPGEIEWLETPSETPDDTG